MTSCKEFNQLQISFYSHPSKQSHAIGLDIHSSVSKINPKVYVENITNHNKKCSQLIHLNPKILFGNQDQKYNQDDKQLPTSIN